MPRKKKKRRKKSRPWKKAEIEMLGTMPDSQLASLIGRALCSVWMKREEMGIPAITERRRLPDEIDELLGIIPDRQLAETFGVSRCAVKKRRVRAGILPAKPSNLSGEK